MGHRLSRHQPSSSPEAPRPPSACATASTSAVRKLRAPSQAAAKPSRPYPGSFRSLAALILGSQCLLGLARLATGASTGAGTSTSCSRGTTVGAPHHECLPWQQHSPVSEATNPTVTAPHPHPDATRASESGEHTFNRYATPFSSVRRTSMFTKARTEANAGFERVEVRGRRRSEAANARMVCVEHAVLQTMGFGPYRHTAPTESASHDRWDRFCRGSACRAIITFLWLGLKNQQLHDWMKVTPEPSSFVPPPAIHSCS